MRAPAAGHHRPPREALSAHRPIDSRPMSAAGIDRPSRRREALWAGLPIRSRHCRHCGPIPFRRPIPAAADRRHLPIRRPIRRGADTGPRRPRPEGLPASGSIARPNHPHCAEGSGRRPSRAEALSSSGSIASHRLRHCAAGDRAAPRRPGSPRAELPIPGRYWRHCAADAPGRLRRRAARAGAPASESRLMSAPKDLRPLRPRAGRSGARSIRNRYRRHCGPDVGSPPSLSAIRAAGRSIPGRYWRHCGPDAARRCRRWGALSESLSSCSRSLSAATSDRDLRPRAGRSADRTR